MQDHPPISVVGRRPGISDREIDVVRREVGGRRRAEERIHGARRRRAHVGRIGDPPAPGQAGRGHQDEWIEDDLEAARLEVSDASYEALIARRSSIDEIVAALRDRDQTRRALIETRYPPLVRAARAQLEFAPDIGRRGIDLIRARRQAVAEPGADDRNCRAFGMCGLQLVDRVGIIGLRAAGREESVDRPRGSRRRRAPT